MAKATNQDVCGPLRVAHDWDARLPAAGEGDPWIASAVMHGKHALQRYLFVYNMTVVASIRGELQQSNDVSWLKYFQPNVAIT
jgi:hypothetical protein